MVPTQGDITGPKSSSETSDDEKVSLSHTPEKTSQTHGGGRRHLAWELEGGWFKYGRWTGSKFTSWALPWSDRGQAQLRPLVIIKDNRIT